MAISAMCFAGLVLTAFFLSAEIYAVNVQYYWTYIHWRNGQISVHETAAYQTVAMTWLAMVLTSIIAFLVCLFQYCETDDSNPIGDIERKAEYLRSAKHLADAEREFMASAIERARTGGEYAELDQITEHERVMRDLRRSLPRGRQ